MQGRVSHLKAAPAETRFQQLGKQHAGICRSVDSIFKRPLAADISRRLRLAYIELQGSDAVRQRQSLASEWFLDNYHVLVDAAPVSS